MKKIIIVFFNVACVIGCMLGIMHFFAPYSFKWYLYIPDAPIEIIQSINYINFCFSFLLTGISLLLLIVQKKLFSEMKLLWLLYSRMVIKSYNLNHMAMAFMVTNMVSCWFYNGAHIYFNSYGIFIKNI